MREQKRYHQRKLAIIEMIEECDIRIKNENKYLNKRYGQLTFDNALENIVRYQRIKRYLTDRYNRNRYMSKLDVILLYDTNR